MAGALLFEEALRSIGFQARVWAMASHANPTDGFPNRVRETEHSPQPTDSLHPHSNTRTEPVIFQDGGWEERERGLVSEELWLFNVSIRVVEIRQGRKEGM